MLTFEKLFYVIISTILVTIFILFTFIFSPNAVDNSRGKIKTIYFADNISKAHQKIIDLFNKKYAGQIKVETINLPFEKFSTNERKELLARYLRSKSNRIDIFSVDIIWVPRFAKWCIPLNSIVDSSSIKKIIPEAIKSCQYESRLYAVPLYIDIALMYYRDDILRKLPDYELYKKEFSSSISWEKFIQLRDKLNFPANNFYIFQADDYEGLLCSFTELMSNLGSDIISKDSVLLLDKRNSVKAVNFMYDLIYKYNLSPSEVTKLRENGCYKYFIENNSFAVRAWPNFLNEIDQYNVPELKAVLKPAPLPHLSGSNAASVFGGWNLMVSKYSENIQEVSKFFEFILSKDAQKILFEEGNYLPVISEIYSDTSFVNQHEELKFYKQLFGTGVYRPFLEEYTNVSDILSFFINNVLKNEMPVEQAIIEASEKIKTKTLFN